jgi:hypothetical protein
MLTRTNLGLTIEQDELKGFARTIAEIEWLLLILVLLFLVAGGPKEDGRIAVHMALFFFGAFILALHYVQFYRHESRAKLALETWVMIVFITWVAANSGRIESPLLNLYLLPIIASSLILGKLMTAVEVVAIVICYMALAYDPTGANFATIEYWGTLLAVVAPVVLVAYITTMLAADIRYAVDKIKQVSDTDDLTGLYNMRAFSSILQRAFKQAVRHGHPLSVVMVDSDNLKAVNDAHGLGRQPPVAAPRPLYPRRIARLGRDGPLWRRRIRDSSAGNQPPGRAGHVGTHPQIGRGDPLRHTRRRHQLHREPRHRQLPGGRRQSRGHPRQGGQGDVPGQAARPEPGRALCQRGKRLRAVTSDK